MATDVITIKLLQKKKEKLIEELIDKEVKMRYEGKIELFKKTELEGIRKQISIVDEMIRNETSPISKTQE